MYTGRWRAKLPWGEAAQEGVITSLCSLILNILLWNMCAINNTVIKKKRPP
jgi:hypothetical protein